MGNTRETAQVALEVLWARETARVNILANVRDSPAARRFDQHTSLFDKKVLPGHVDKAVLKMFTVTYRSCLLVGKAGRGIVAM